MGRFSGPGPPTDSSMLRRLRDLRDEETWGRFIDVYGPYLAGVLRRRGIAEADILDAVQETFVVVMDRIGDFQYDRGKRFRSWLATIALRKAWRQRRQGPAPGLRPQGGTTNLMVLGNRAGGHDDWEPIESRLQIALQMVRTQVSPLEWQAFQWTVLECIENKAAAEKLGISIGHLYVCKSRVKSALEHALEEIDE